MSVTSARLNKSTPALSGLYVHLAPDLETHSNTLIQSLLPAYSSPEATLDALFNPPTLVVPNTIVGDYLRRRIACSELECAFGIEVQTFSAFISSQSSSDVGYTVDRLRTAVLAVFFTPSLRSKLPKQLASYLNSAPPGVTHPGLRGYQMADRLARIFSRYDREQADILDAWNKNSAAPCGKLRSATEEWQRALWRLMRMTGLLPLKGEEPSDSKDTSVRKLQINPPTSSLKPTHTPIYLVGFSVLPEKSIKDLITISKGRRLDLLLVAPRAETLTAAITGDPIPLWIKPQMETLAALRRLLPKDAFQNEDMTQSSTKDETSLRALQRLISTAQPPAKRLDYSKDHSLRILGCPGITREAEVIADEIWRLLAYDEHKQTSDGAPLTMSDVAVYIADKENLGAYTAALTMAFRQNHNLPSSVEGAPDTPGAGLLAGIRTLLDLTISDIKRTNLERFLTNDAVCRRFRMDPQAIGKLCDRYAIFHGADHQDHVGTYIEADLYNWDQGLKRMVLEKWLAPSDDGTPLSCDLGEYTYHLNPRSQGQSSLPQVILPIRALIADLRSLANQSEDLTLGEWGARFARMVQDYMAPALDEGSTLRRCIETLLSLGGTEAETQAVRVPLAVAAEMAKDQIGTMERGSAFRASKGIYIGELNTGNPIPYRAVFICGITSNHFPLKEDPSELDIRDPDHVPFSKRNLGMAAMVEQVLAARDSLVLSFSSTGEDLNTPQEPSPLLQQLQVLLEEKILTPVSKANPLIVSHPLYGFDAQYSLLNKDNSAHHVSDRYVSFAPDAVQQQIALSARAEHDGVYPETFGHTLRAEVLQGYGFDPSQDCPFPLPVAGVSPGISGITAELIPKTLTINAIKDFLENPLQGWSRHILGLPRTWDADSESLSKDCEPYTLGNISKMSICRNVMDHLLAEHHSPGQPSEDKVQDMIKKMMRIEIEAGKLPSGAYLHYPKKIISDLINLYIKRLNDNDAFNASSSYCRYRFGQGTSIPQAIKIIDPLLIKIPKHKVFGERQVEITGDTQMMNEGEKTFFFFAGGQSNHHLIKPYIDCLCHSASLSGEEKLSTYTVVYAFKKGLNHHRLQLSPKKSYETLSKILFDMIYLVHDYHLTFQAISNERYDKSSIYKLLAKDAFESNAPIWRYDNYPIPEDDYIRSMVERRYQDILDLLQNTK